jgi:prepilin-type N-terminal cleavage/methylation domain-containing protein
VKLKKYSSGFTLIEVLIAVMLVGLAIAALMAANTALTNANGAGTDLSTAEFLISEIAELTALLPVVDPENGTSTFGPETGEALANYDDLDDFNGSVFSPPISSERNVINSASGFSQQITVNNVSASNFEQVVGNHTSDFVRITVRIFLNAREISSESWLRARY